MARLCRRIVIDLTTLLPDALREMTWLGATAAEWLLLVVGVVLATALMGLIRRAMSAVIDRTKRTQQSRAERVAELLVDRTRDYFLFAAALLVAAVLVWDGRGVRGTAWIFGFALALQIGRWGDGVIAMWSTGYRRRHLDSDAASVTTMQAASVLLRIALWSVVLLALLTLSGINVTTLVAGIGITGIAIGLAVQSILGDLFASLSIILDRPFVIGDFLVVGEEKGTVEHIGLKSTRVLSLGGEQIVFSNGDLLASRIRNYQRMEERRVVLTVGVVYQTPPAVLAAIPDMLRQIVESSGDEPRPLVRFDRAHFAGMGAYSLDFEIVYWLLSPDFTTHMDAKQGILLDLFAQFTSADIGFAYPTQTLLMDADTPFPLHVASGSARPEIARD